MMLLAGILKGFAALFTYTGLWLMLWIVVLVGFSIFLIRTNKDNKKPQAWVVRKGRCPFCNHELFGATREYQRLNLLEPLAPESKSLCTSCDNEKVSGILSNLG